MYTRGSRGVVVVVVFVLSFQRARVAGRVLRHHVGRDEDVLGADERGVDEDVLDRARSGRRSWVGKKEKGKKSNALAASDSSGDVSRFHGTAVLT